MIPHNAQKACDLAVENGWRATFRVVDKPTSVALKLRLVWPGADRSGTCCVDPDLPARECSGCPVSPDCRVWAIWQDGRFWRSYAQTCQRLSYRDLLEVIAQPELLIPEDSEWPFGMPESNAG